MNQTLIQVLKVLMIFSGAVLIYLLATYLKEWFYALIQTKREKMEAIFD